MAGCENPCAPCGSFADCWAAPTCPTCDGTGRVADRTIRAIATGIDLVVCKACDGTGVGA